MSEWCKFKQARLWTACEGTGVSTGGRAHSLRVSHVDQGVQHVCKFLLRMLGFVHSGQPTVIFRVFVANARICAHQSTDHDLANVIFSIKSVTTVMSVTSVILMRIYCFRFIVNL